jgi:hypothetical protein
MKNDRFQIQTRLIEIENDLSSIAKLAGTDTVSILDNPAGWPVEVLSSMHLLVCEKLRLQKALFICLMRLSCQHVSAIRFPLRALISLPLFY